MNSNNIILNLPFDESAGSLVAYDYSRSRADGNVIGADFVAGKNGNAIAFKGDGGYCELSKDIFATIGGVEFSMLFWVQALEVETGTPTKGIWVLNFGGTENFVEVPIELKPGAWYSLAMTRRNNTFTFYVNSSEVATITHAGTLYGISLNQDYYGGEYGLCLLDDVKIYNIALSQAEIIDELSASKQQAYKIDGVDFKEYGVFVSGSRGILNRPKMKTPAELSWDNYHGKAVDLQHKYLEPREIILDCFIKADNKNDFIVMVSRFQQLFDKKGTNRLSIEVHPVKPLIYEVYCQDVIDVSKTWNDALMVGTFQLKLIEPEPVKRILKHIRISDATKTCTITMTTAKMVNVYWGDGSVDYDIEGEEIIITHDYADNGDYFPVITGCIDEITDFETNAIVVWSKL